MASLGMDGAGLRTRGAVLAELRGRLAAPVRSRKPRNVLKKPQPYLLQTGEVIVYPTARGACINPLFPSKKARRLAPRRLGRRRDRRVWPRIRLPDLVSAVECA